MVEIHGPVFADQRHVVRIKGSEACHVRQVFNRVVLGDLEGTPAPRHDLVLVLQELVALGDRNVLVDPTRNGTGAMDLLAGGGLDDLLPVFPEHDPLDCQFGELLGHTDDIADRGIGIETEEQVRGRQVEEVQSMRLQRLAVVHQAPHLFRRGRQDIDTVDEVHGLGGSQVMADRADTTEALHGDRGFPIGAALNEALKATELDDVQPGLFDLVFRVQQDRDFAVPFHAGNGLDDNFS